MSIATTISAVARYLGTRAEPEIPSFNGSVEVQFLRDGFQRWRHAFDFQVFGITKGRIAGSDYTYLNDNSGQYTAYVSKANYSLFRGWKGRELRGDYEDGSNWSCDWLSLSLATVQAIRELAKQAEGTRDEVGRKALENILRQEEIIRQLDAIRNR